MTEEQPFHKANHIYSIQLMKKDSECAVYEVRITGDLNRYFFIEITASQNTRKGVLQGIEQWCDSHFDKLPIEGKPIQIDLDEIRKK
jgi:hypothetical protein